VRTDSLVPRTSPSPADQALIDHAQQRALRVSATQFERWRGADLLPCNPRRSLGKGHGSISRTAPSARELVVWLAEHARPGMRPRDLALVAFGSGLSVPEAGVRAAFADVVDDISDAAVGCAAAGHEYAAVWEKGHGAATVQGQGVWPVRDMTRTMPRGLERPSIGPDLGRPTSRSVAFAQVGA